MPRLIALTIRKVVEKSSSRSSSSRNLHAQWVKAWNPGNQIEIHHFRFLDFLTETLRIFGVNPRHTSYKITCHRNEIVKSWSDSKMNFHPVIKFSAVESKLVACVMKTRGYCSITTQRKHCARPIVLKRNWKCNVQRTADVPLHYRWCLAAGNLTMPLEKRWFASIECPAK